MSSARGLSSVSAALACALALLPAAPAGARKFQMSGTWIYRNGQVFIPLQFAAAGMNGFRTIRASMGNLTGAFGFPNGPIPGAGGVTATGSGPATLRIPAHRFVEDAMAIVPLNGVTLIQITTNYGIDAPYVDATLAAGLGPGSFTWCPDHPACLAGGGMLSTDPPGVRILYSAGANRFGGAIQLGLRRGTDTAFRFHSSPLQVGHRLGGGGSTLRAVAVGGLGSADAPSVRDSFPARGFATQPTKAPPAFSPILYPGPKVTTMFGTTMAGSGPTYYFPQGGTAGPPVYTRRYGFGATTGTVFVQLSTYSQTFFTAMGSDARTPLGAGNLALTAGGVSFRHSLVGLAPYGSFQKVSVTLAPPIPSLSPAGIATAAALVLLAAGYALRRRLG